MTRNGLILSAGLIAIAVVLGLVFFTPEIALAGGTLMLVALAAILTVVGVMYVGSKEDLNAHDEESRATNVWKERAERVNAARNGLVVVADTGSSEAVASNAPAVASITGTADEAEARRQAALARKAARANKTGE
jgi:hypothetical protein